MEEQQPQQIPEMYIPSSNEKKRALMMYLLFGIMMVMADKKANPFEYFHLKQAMGWWMVVLFILMIALIILFLPLIRILGILCVFIIMGAGIFMMKQARDGKMYVDLKGYPLAIFSSLGNWLLSLFDIKIDTGE